MAKKKQPNIPPEIPVPNKTPEIFPKEPPPGEIPPTPKSPFRFITLLLAAFALVPGMAHLLEMPHKMQLTEENYGIVQYLYRGWAWLGIIQVGAVISTGVLYFIERQNKARGRLVLGALVCQVLTLVIFFAYTYPVNVVTQNWSFVPDNWHFLRDQWEYSHAANALLEGLAYVLLLLGNLRTK